MSLEAFIAHVVPIAHMCMLTRTQTLERGSPWLMD